MARITPNIYTEGLFILKAPWDTALPTDKAFVCNAIRSYSEILQDGTDPYETYYVPYGVSQDDYNADVAQDVCIITLISQDETVIVYVPDTYILYAPTNTPAVCNQVALALNLGLIPSYMDLTSAKTALALLVQQQFGVQGNFLEQRVTSASSVSSAVNQANMAAWDANIVSQQSSAGLIRSLNAQANDVSARIASAYALMRSAGLLTNIS